MIKVKVPATSANLGVGYDCLGIALDDYGVFYFEELEEGLIIEGCKEEYCNEDNLIYQAYLKGMQALGLKCSGLHIIVDSDIPSARGMGSSATCILAGLFAANALHQNKLNKYEIFDLATQMEHHPDNVAPALFGGLCVSFMEDCKPNMIRFGVKRDLHFVAMIPDYEVSTASARKVLPTSMSYEDATYQMGRCCALAKAIEIGNGLIIKKANCDKMQEPYRKQLIPDYDDVKAICEKEEMITMFISGSGSTLLALSQDEQACHNLIAHMRKKYPTWDLRLLHATYDGAFSEVQ